MATVNAKTPARSPLLPEPDAALVALPEWAGPENPLAVDKREEAPLDAGVEAPPVVTEPAPVSVGDKLAGPVAEAVGPKVGAPERSEIS